MSATSSRLFTRDFTLVVFGTFLFWVAFGTSLPVLPRFVVDALGGGEAAVGLVFGAYAVAAVAARPGIGRLGDRRGRRILVVVGAVLTAIGLLGHLVAGSIAMLVVCRLIAGAGQAAVVVGFATMALDLAAPHRHGEASSFVMVAVQLGMGTGPLIGELLLGRGGYALVWIVGAVGSLACVLVAAVLPSEDRQDAPLVPVGWFHPAAVRPGVIMGLGVLGFVGYLAFVPLYAVEVGIERVAPLFLLSSGTIALVRALAARVPDRIGAVRGASGALVLLAVAFVGMGTLPTPAGLAASTLLMAVGAALLAPCLVLASVQGVPYGERARVMATFTMFLDLASAIGPSTLGVVAAVTGYGATFVAAGVAAGIGLVLLRRWVAPRLVTVPG